VAVIDLKYLESMAGGDEEIIQELKDLFIAQVPEFIDNLKKHLKEEDFIELGKEAHKAKSSVLIMGMEELAKDLKNFQLIAIAGIDKETYPYYIQKFEEQCLQAIEELKDSHPK
jgi:HPt (histidine-containing phosphotransfer) domain-containing protein